MTGNDWAAGIRLACGRINGDEAVSFMASAATLLGVAEQDFPDTEVGIRDIVRMSNLRECPTGMPFEEAVDLLLEILNAED